MSIPERHVNPYFQLANPASDVKTTLGEDWLTKAQVGGCLELECIEAVVDLESEIAGGFVCEEKGSGI